MNCHYGRIVALVEPVVAIGLLLILVDGFRGATCKLLKIIVLGVFRGCQNHNSENAQLSATQRFTGHARGGRVLPADVVLKVGVTNS